jgi:hypothetical protein
VNTPIRSDAFSPQLCLGDSDDRESILSDYSEMAEPVKEHLANMQVLQEAELCLNLPAQPFGCRHWLTMNKKSDEDDADCRRHQQKMNFLSLAQEFAALKTVNAEALPFNLHLRRSIQTVTEPKDACYTMATLEEHQPKTLSHIAERPVSRNVDELSSKLLTGNVHHTVGDPSSNIPTNLCTDNICVSSTEVRPTLENSVPDIVRDLHNENETKTELSNSNSVSQPRADVTGRTDVAAENDSSRLVACCCVTETNAGRSKPESHLALVSCQKCLDDRNLIQSRQRERENIRLRLVLGDDDDVMSLNSRISSSTNLASCRTSSASLRMCYFNEAAFDDEDSNCCDEEAVLQLRPDIIANTTTTTRHTSTPAHNMFVPIHHHFTVGEHTTVKDCVTTDTQLNLNADVMSWKMDRYDRLSLQRNGVGQLQVIVNDQLARVEALNTELMKCLVEREDLHRVQDSLLVDVMDLSGYLSRAVADPNADSDQTQLS